MVEFIIHNRKFVGLKNQMALQDLFLYFGKELSDEISNSVKQPNFSSGELIDAISAGVYLNEIRNYLEKKLLTIAGKNSSVAWLYFLRRLPRAFFVVGSLPTNELYVQSLAEIASGNSGGQLNSEIITEDPIDFAWDGEEIYDLLNLCSTAQQLKRIHALIRIAGKGVSFDPIGDYGLTPKPSQLQHEALKFYDKRGQQGEIPFLKRAGTSLSPPEIVLKYPLLIVVRTFQYYDEGDVVGFGNIPKSFGISEQSFSEAAAFSTLNPGDSWRKEAVLLVMFLRLGQLMLSRQPEFKNSLALYGYIKTSPNDFRAIVDRDFNYLLNYAKELLPEGDLPLNSDQLLEKLERTPSSLWPMKLGPAVRKEGEILYLDFCAATSQFEESLILKNLEGEKANFRATHFERLTRNFIGQSPWGDIPASIQKLVNKPLKDLNDKILTDVDAFGVLGDRLLLVDCCSRPFSIEHEIDDHRTIRNSAQTIENKAKKRVEKKQFFIKNPKTSLYDFSAYKEIIAVVCTPSIFYIEPEMIGENCSFQNLASMQEAAVDLFTASSLSELLRWLHSHDNESE